MFFPEAAVAVVWLPTRLIKFWPSSSCGAYEHAVAWVELGDDPLRYLVVVPDRAGNLLVVIEAGDGVLVIHAMPLRPSTEREVFGDEP